MPVFDANVFDSNVFDTGADTLAFFNLQPRGWSQLWGCLSMAAQAELLAACGGVVYEDRTMFYGAPSTPGMARGSTPTFWKREDAFLNACWLLGLNLIGFPQALYVGVKNGAVVGRLVAPGPVLFLALNDLSDQTVTDLLLAIRALLPP